MAECKTCLDGAKRFYRPDINASIFPPKIREIEISCPSCGRPPKHELKSKKKP